MSALIAAIRRISQKQLPVVVIGAACLSWTAGPASPSRTQSGCDDLEVSPLSEAAAALMEPVQTEGANFTDEAIGEVVRKEYLRALAEKDPGSHRSLG